MTKRSIPKCVILTCVTFGIYGFYLVYKISDEVIKASKMESIDNPIMNVVWYVLTCGTYSLWWNYKISNYLGNLEKEKGLQPDFWAPVFSLTFGTILHISRMNRLVA